MIALHHCKTENASYILSKATACKWLKYSGITFRGFPRVLGRNKHWNNRSGIYKSMK